MPNAYVTVDPDGKLAPGSAVTVDIPFGSVMVSVPAGCHRHGFILVWHRVREALEQIGWTPDGVGPGNGWHRDGDVVRFNAKPIR